jgi:hypothetical protein
VQRTPQHTVQTNKLQPTTRSTLPWTSSQAHLRCPHAIRSTLPGEEQWSRRAMQASRRQINRTAHAGRSRKSPPGRPSPMAKHSIDWLDDLTFETSTRAPVMGSNWICCSIPLLLRGYSLVLRREQRRRKACGILWSSQADRRLSTPQTGGPKDEKRSCNRSGRHHGLGGNQPTGHTCGRRFR